MRALKVILVALGVLVVFLFPPVLPLWLAALSVRRRRRGQPALPVLPLLTRPGRIVFYAVGWIGLALVTVLFVAAMIQTSADEHAAPVLGVFVLFALFLIVVGDVLAQGVLATVRATLPRLRQR